MYVTTQLSQLKYSSLSTVEYVFSHIILCEYVWLMWQYLSNPEVALFCSCQIVLEGEVLVICDKGKSVNPLLLQQQLEAPYHNCHLKPSPPWVSPSEQSIWWPLLFLISTNIIFVLICTNQTSKEKAFSIGLNFSNHSEILHEREHDDIMG